MKTPTLENRQSPRETTLTPYQRQERRIVATLINHLNKQGFKTWCVWDGEEKTTTKTIKETMEIVFNLDEAWLYFVKKGFMRHYVYIVRGNAEPALDMICDYSYTDGDPDGFEAAMEQFTKKLEDANP